MISKCPSCQAPIQVPPEAVGKKVRCTGCQAIFVIEPEPVTAPPPPPVKRHAKEEIKPKKIKKTTDADMKPAPPPKNVEPKTKPIEAIKKEEPKKKPAPKQASGNPFDFGGGSVAPAGPAADFSFAPQPADQVNRGVRLRARAAASFMNYGVAYALIPVLVQIAYSVVMTLALEKPIFAAVGCCALSLYIVAAVLIVIGARQLEKMRSFGMAITGAIFSLFLALGGLLPSVGLSVLLGLAIVAGIFVINPGTLLAMGVIVLCFIQFIFSFWGGIRTIMVLMNAEVRKAMGTKPETPP